MRWLLRLLACILGWISGSWVGAIVFARGGALGVVLFATLAALAVYFVILNATFSRFGVRAALTDATELRRFIILLLVFFTVGACFSGVFWIWAFSVIPTFFLSVLGPSALSLQVTTGQAVYFIPAFILVLSSLALAATDFFLARSEAWNRVRPVLDENNALLLQMGLVLLVLSTAIVALFLGSAEYLISFAVLVFCVVCLLVVDYALSGSRIVAVARHMIAEGFRMKVALVIIAILVLLLPVLPFVMAGDGLTLTSRVQMFLTYSLWLSGLLLSLLTVFLACSTIAGEIRGKQIWMVASKPIPRWEFFAGKWLGIVTLDAMLLLLTGACVWGFTTYLSHRPTSIPDDEERLKNEVMSARYGVKAEKPDFSIEVDNRLRKLREEGRATDLSPQGEAELRAQIAEDLKKGWWSIGPQTYQDYNFKDLRVDRSEGQWMHFHVKPITPTGVDDLEIPIVWQAGNPNEVSTITEPHEYTLICGRFTTIPIPARAVDSQGALHLRVANTDPRNSVTFEGDDSFQLMYDLGTFHWNLFRALGVIWCRLAFLAVLGLLTSCCLSFPVACMMTFLVLLVASASKFLMEAIDSAAARPDGTDPLYIFGPILRPIGYAFVWLVPDFSTYDPIGNVATGQVVPIMWVLTSLVMLVFIKGLIVGALGGIVLTKRELAQVTV